MPSTPPTFSIITVTRNASPYIERTILSVLAQSYPAIEYIIIDGASTDGTTDVIKTYESGITYWTSEPDAGIYHAMNKGISKATGDYLWFINAGDSFHSSDTVQQLSLAIQKRQSPPDIIYGETMLIDQTGATLGNRRLKSPQKLSWRSFRMGMLVCHQSFVTRRAIAPEFDLQYRYSSDFDWCIRCMKSAVSILNAKSVLSCFMEGGVSDRQRKASLRERYDIMRRYYGLLPTALRHIWFAIRFYILK
ncbi:MAG: glycosyltransferase [Tannerellaceae bacterium]|nr:glycosyltransferase [Tannerellaceae bacterium]